MKGARGGGKRQTSSLPGYCSASLPVKRANCRDVLLVVQVLHRVMIDRINHGCHLHTRLSVNSYQHLSTPINICQPTAINRDAHLSITICAPLQSTPRTTWVRSLATMSNIGSSQSTLASQWLSKNTITLPTTPSLSRPCEQALCTVLAFGVFGAQQSSAYQP